MSVDYCAYSIGLPLWRKGNPYLFTVKIIGLNPVLHFKIAIEKVWPTEVGGGFAGPNAVWNCKFALLLVVQ